MATELQVKPGASHNDEQRDLVLQIVLHAVQGCPTVLKCSHAVTGVLRTVPCYPGVLVSCHGAQIR